MASKVKFPGGSQSLCQIPRLGNLLWVLELSQQCENFFGIIVLQFVSHLLSCSMVGLTATYPKKTYSMHCASQVCCSQSLCPHDRPLPTPASAEDTQLSKVGLTPSLVEVTAPFSGSWCAQGFVCALQDSSNPTGPSKSNSLGVLSPYARSPGWEICCGP